ncbi:MAG: DMT family transporter [Hyphomonadaceae bacterium]|nr:DMT family transporter [Hyphomonadaceae bacterium]MCA8886176.1 DMT family transporter [Hyphomonadaceae bacterium]
MVDLGATYGRLSTNVRGALWMLASAVTFTLMTSLIKYLGDDYSPALQTFYRQAAGILVLVPIVLRDPVGAFRTSRPGILLFRSLAGTLGMVLAFWAYQKMPLAEANALSFTRTLWIVPLAIFVLGEKIGPWRLGATLIGFAGVLIMLQPSIANAVGWPAAAALSSAALFAMTVTGMKVMTRDHSVTVLMVWSAALGFVLSIPLAVLEWRWPEPLDLALLAAMGVLGLVTQVCYIKGMSLGDAAAMAPIDYTRLVFAILFGLALFHEVPNMITMFGALIVIGSTLVITLRELHFKQKPPPVRAD